MWVFFRFYRYVFKYKALFTVFFLLFLAANILTSLQPFFLRNITALVTTGGFYAAAAQVFWLGVILIGSTLLTSLAMYISDRNVIKSAVVLQTDIMRRIHDLDFCYHTNKSSGRLISIMKRGEDAFFNFYDILNREAFSIVINFAVMVYAFASLHPKYLILSLVVLIISLLISLPLVRVNLIRRRRYAEIDDQVSGVRVDNLVNFDTVKYFAKEEFEQRRLSDLLELWGDAYQNYFVTFRYFDITVGNLANIAIAGSLLFAVLDLQSRSISLPQFILIAAFTTTFYPKLVNIIMSLRAIAKRYTDLELYFSVLNEDVTVKDPDHPQTLSTPVGGIQFDHMSFHYPQNTVSVFSDFSLTITPGQSVALVGLSGSGKTTLIKLLMRMYDLTGGSITIDSVDISAMAKTYLRSLIGIVPQDPILFNHTLLYNLAYAKPDATPQEIAKALEASKLSDFVASLPDGLKTTVGERGIKLSGGQRQRLAIARVLLEQPKIIVLDEATSSLDSESEKTIQESFWAMVKNPKAPKTSIIIAHRLSTVMRADRIIVLHDGQIQESGTHSQLLRKKSGLYNHLWTLQSHGFLVE